MAQNDLKRIGLGSAQFGMHYGFTNAKGKTPINEVQQILITAVENGIQTIDTAYAYGDSEVVLGNYDLSKFRVISKFSGKQQIDRLSLCLDQSAKRLKVSSLYAYISHGAELLLKNPMIWEQCLELKEEKRIQKTGYSVYTTEELDKLLSKNYLPDLIQVPYSMVDRRFEPYFEQLKQNGAEIHVRSCFLQGLLFSPPNQLPDFFKPIFSFLQEFREEFNSSDEQAAALIQFCLRNPSVDIVIIGINDSSQLKRNLYMIKKDLNMPAKSFAAVDLPDEILLPYKWPQYE